jgi:hypothetical protein
MYEPEPKEIARLFTEWEAAADRDPAAMGQLWKGWRDDRLDIWNGYREIWRPSSFSKSSLS